MIIDSHAHLNFQDFSSDYQEIIDDCQKNDIWMINVGSNLKTSKRAVEIAGQYEKGVYPAPLFNKGGIGAGIKSVTNKKWCGVYSAVGLHPIHALGSDFHPEEFVEDEYRNLIKSSKKVVAIGETGLDFFHSDKNIAKQKEIFIKHLNLAKEFDLPVILHSRNSKDGEKDAYEEILEIIKRENAAQGVIHCFSGSVQQALAFLDQGFYVGFTGIITFDKTGQLAEAVANLPLEAILVETDSPYLSPEPHRGERNQPQYVRFVAEKIAQIKKIDYNKVEKQTVKNTINLFNL